jgi:hypothetical protein
LKQPESALEIMQHTRIWVAASREPMNRFLLTSIFTDNINRQIQVRSFSTREKGESEMRTSKSILVVSLGLFVLVALACKFSASTANISSLKIGKNKTVTTEASTFAPSDTVYAVATISNTPGKVKVKGRLVIEDAAGEKGPEDTVELPGSGTATFTFTPPASGFPPGKYKIEVTLMDESGEQKDQKSGSFTVS